MIDRLASTADKMQMYSGRKMTVAVHSFVEHENRSAIKKYTKDQLETAQKKLIHSSAEDIDVSVLQELLRAQDGDAEQYQRELMSQIATNDEEDSEASPIQQEEPTNGKFSA